MHAQLATLLGAEADKIYPMELAKAFPRIIDRIVELWPKGSALEDYFDGLLVDRRGGREGFPEPVLLEIFALKNYYQATKRTPALNVHTWGELTNVDDVGHHHA